MIFGSGVDFDIEWRIIIMLKNIFNNYKFYVKKLLFDILFFKMVIV